MPIDLALARQQLATVQAALDALRQTLTTEVLTVPKGGNLQAAIDAAVPGTIIKVVPGVYAPIALRAKPAGAPIIIRPDTANLPERPGAAGRIGPGARSDLIQIASPGSAFPVQADAGAARYVLRGFAPLPYADRAQAFAIFGDPTVTDAAQLPAEIVCDQWLIEADPAKGGKRGFAPNCRAFTLSRSHLAGLYWIDDAQGVCGWSGTQTIAILDNYIEASGENILFGGADSESPELMPQDIRVTGNHLTKPLAWRSAPAVATANVKNSFELKCALRVRVEGNLIEHSWVYGQAGYLVVLTVRDQNGKAPWSTIADVTIRDNVIRHGAAGFQILGLDSKPSVRMQTLRIVNNLVHGIDPRLWNHPVKGEAGAGRLVQISGGPFDVEIAHNTMVGTNLNSFLSLGDPADQYKAERLSFLDNIVTEGSYGIAGADVALGRPALDAYAPDARLEGNVIVRGTSGRRIPYGPQPNSVIDAPGWDPLTPLPGGPYETTDGALAGADRAQFSAWLRETAGV